LAADVATFGIDVGAAAAGAVAAAGAAAAAGVKIKSVPFLE